MRQTKTETWQGASQWRRWLAFNSIGFLGILVQLGVLSALTLGLGWNYLLSTLLAVEVAILHNFTWHEHWTWVDQTSGTDGGRFRRLVRFHMANGVISLIGNLLLMWLFVGLFRIHTVPANICAIAICSLVNFVASDRWVFRARSEDMRTSGKQRESEPEPYSWRGIMRRRRLSHGTTECRKRKKELHFMGCVPLLMAGIWLAHGMRLEAAQLRGETVNAWTQYAARTEQRIDRELAATRGTFLALDYQPAAVAAAERRAILIGDIPVSHMKTNDATGKEFDVPFGMIHHWRGSVFIPGVDIGFILSRVSNPGLEDTRQEDVLDSRVMDRNSDSLKLYLKLRRVKFVTVVYNTEHAVRYGWHGKTRAFSRSVATRIAEVEDAGSPGEREKPIGQDRGFLWRLNSYWRYEQVPGGVIVECESISLSRTVPGWLEVLIRPMIDSAARESMARTLGSLRERMMRAAHVKADPQIP